MQPITGRQLSTFALIWSLLLTVFTYDVVPLWGTFALCVMSLAVLGWTVYAAMGGRNGILERRYLKLLDGGRRKELTEKTARELNELSKGDYAKIDWFDSDLNRRAYAVLCKAGVTPPDVMADIAALICARAAYCDGPHLWNTHLSNFVTLTTIVRHDPFGPLLVHPNLRPEDARQAVSMLMEHAAVCNCRHQQLTDLMTARPEMLTPEDQSALIIAIAIS